MTDMEPLDHGEVVVSAWNSGGAFYAVTNRGRVLRQYGGEPWRLDSAIPCKPPREWVFDK